MNDLNIVQRFKMVNIIQGLMVFSALIAVCSLVCAAAGDKAKDPLLFPKDNFSIETMTVQTSAGVKKVTYRSYKHILYVTKSVDKDYESLNVSVPIKVDDKDIDATNAPILFANGAAGYMSFNNATRGIGMNNANQGDTDRGAPGSQGGPGVQSGPGGMVGSPADGGAPPSDNKAPALAAGFVVVEPGCRGRDNKASDGTYFGKAPAAIVDLKAAVRYIRHNKGVMPGNVDWIVSTGCSAGGGLSSLLGASGNSHMFDSYLKEIGAADGDDSIFAAACYSPVTDLDHADMAYEWMYGPAPLSSTGKLADQTLSKQLKALFITYQASLNLKGRDNFGTITSDNYDKYLLKYYLIPSATKYLKELSDDARNKYLEKHKWITWSNNSAVFTFSDYLVNGGRVKGVPSVDDLELKTPEAALFGNKTTDARHFTNFSLQQATGDKNAKVDNDLQTVVNMMNPMYFIGQNNPGCAKHWWIRQGAGDRGISQANTINIATGLENHNKDVNMWLFWDATHCQDDDTEGFIAWIVDITGFEPVK
ncbi:MAG: alpha/beta hydrolase [Deltaproteobacteria bacterium]|nr:alpha/beta hydrolase [Deltaproteobacteria bacterium]